MVVRHGAPTRPLLASLVYVLWLSLVLAGFVAVHRHETDPGPPGRPLGSWPEVSEPFLAARPHLVMLIHPRCPCSRASLTILAEVMRAAQPDVDLRVLVYRPWGSRPDWSGPLKTIPGAIIRDDPGGRVASQFGLETSGTVIAYDANGRRGFAGGITSGATSVEPNPGSEAVLAMLLGRRPELEATPVFGCSIIDRSEADTPPGESR